MGSRRRRTMSVPTYRRPSAIFRIGEDSGDESDKYNEFDSDVEIDGRNRRISSVSICSTDSLDSVELEMEKDLKEKGQRRRPSIAPPVTGLQTWVERKPADNGSTAAGRRQSVSELLQVPTNLKRKKFEYDEIKELVTSGKVKEIKKAIRDSDWEITADLRTRLWPLLDSIYEDNASDIVEGFYWETVNQIFGSDELPNMEITLPGCISPDHRIYYKLSDEGKRICERVVTVICFTYPDITYCPLLFPMTALFLHYVQEEKTFNCICTLLKARHKTFMTQTKNEWDVAYHTMMLLTKKFSKSAYTYVTRHLKDDEKVETVFEPWVWWIFRDLPFSHIVRVLDCFLMEGNKVLYRTAIALLLSFSKQANSETKWANRVDTDGVSRALSAYIGEIAMTPQRLLKSAFAIRGFSGAEIQKTSNNVELLVKSKIAGGGSSAHGAIPTMDIEELSRTLTIKELLTLWSWLPSRITMYQPVLLFSTEEHGCSLNTFYNRVEAYEPTILLIKSTTDEVFGAYLSAQWSNRNSKDERGDRVRYFGTGETFLFSLWPKQLKYGWVGLNRNKIEDSDEDLKHKIGHSSELFMHAEPHLISIGGGEGQGIYLDEELRFGKSEKCLTFNNPPLVSTGDFEVRVLEVFGFEQG